jgi:adenylate cyclase
MKMAIVILVCTPLLLHAQKKQGPALMDSLVQELPKAKEDTGKVKLLLSLSSMYANSNPDEGLKYGQQGLVLARSLKWNRGIAAAYKYMGGNYTMTDQEKAMENYANALKVYTAAGDKGGMAGIYIRMGGLNEGKGALPAAMKNYFAALKLYEETGDRSGIGSANNGIGGIYDWQANYSEALRHYALYLKTAKELNDRAAEASAYTNMGLVYDNMGVFTRQTAHFDTALSYLADGLKIKTALGNMPSIANTYNSIGNAWYHKKNYEEALKNRFEAIKIYEAVKARSRLAPCYTNIGQCYLRMQKYDDAEKYLLKGLELAKEMKSLAIMEMAYDKLHEVYEQTGKYDSSLKSYELYVNIRDSISNNANSKQIMQTQMQYDFDKKEAAAIAEQDKQNALMKKTMEFDFDKKQTVAIAEQEKKEALAKETMVYNFDKRTAAERAIQEKKNAVAAEAIKKQTLLRNTFMGGFGIFLLFSFVVYRQRNKFLKQKERSDELLLNILPAEVAEELKATGGSIAKHFDNVTVMLTDFVGFTSAGERMSAQELVQELDTCFRAFDDIIVKYGIEKIKTIGDGYLAVCGLPKANPQHATNMVNAAIGISNYMHDRKLKMEDKTFDIRIGLHSGNVVAGIVGIKKFAYDIWGDTVNTAARMEQNCEPGKINISQTTYDLLNGRFNCNYRGEIEAKNKGDLSMYFVETIKETEAAA